MGLISFFRPSVSPGGVWRGTASLPAGLQPGSPTSTVVSYRTSANRNVAPRDAPQHNAVMRVLALLLVSAGMAFGIYQYSLKKMPVSDLGTAPTQAISLTGVRGDLLQIAQAERSFTALNDHCASIDELISSNSLTMQRPERDGYTYTVQCSGGDFTAIASHPPAAAGSPIRYPTLAIDQTMQVHEQN
jgi:hypothetical protein